MTKHTPSGFATVPKTGVIYVTSKAIERGFTYEHPEWANLGQGAPEVGQLHAQDDRVQSIHMEIAQHEYAPVGGLPELRTKIAALYNTLYRKDKKSQYTSENVAICSGGRLALTRLAAALGNVHLGHFIPDYTAYEELLNAFQRFTPIPLPLAINNYAPLTAEAIEQNIINLGLKALLLSNPCNPTGQLIAGEQLAQWLQVSRKNECSMIFDEFYSHYIYSQNAPVSAAEYIEDVNKDSVIIVDGLTKNWRYPGWRISWTIGPKSVIETVTSAGSFLDGGASHPLQKATCALLDPATVQANQTVLRQHFLEKRDFTLSRLRSLGIDVPCTPEGSFYCFANLHNLPEPLRNGLSFFEAGLEEKVITVPGEFFDVNPGKRRTNARFKEYCRISFGPSLEVLERGFNAIERVIHKHS